MSQWRTVPAEPDDKMNVAGADAMIDHLALPYWGDVSPAAAREVYAAMIAAAPEPPMRPAPAGGSALVEWIREHRARYGSTLAGAMEAARASRQQQLDNVKRALAESVKTPSEPEPATPAQPARWLVDIPGTDGVAMRDEAAARRLAERTDGAAVRALYEAPPEIERLGEPAATAEGGAANDPKDAIRAVEASLLQARDDVLLPLRSAAWERGDSNAALAADDARNHIARALHDLRRCARLREQLAAAEQREQRLLGALTDARESAQEMATLLARTIGGDYAARAGTEGDAP